MSQLTDSLLMAGADIIRLGAGVLAYSISQSIRKERFQRPANLGQWAFLILIACASSLGIVVILCGTGISAAMSPDDPGYVRYGAFLIVCSLWGVFRSPPAGQYGRG